MQMCPPLSPRESLLTDLAALSLRLADTHPDDRPGDRLKRLARCVQMAGDPAAAPPGVSPRELFPLLAGLHPMAFGSPDAAVRGLLAAALADFVLANTLAGPLDVAGEGGSNDGV